MKIFGILAILLVALVVGGFTYIASTDVAVEQTTITHDVPTDNLK